MMSRVSDAAGGCEEDWREGKAIREGFMISSWVTNE